MEAVSVREIDISCRPPLLLYFGSGLAWLFVGTLLALIASIKLHGPGFLSDIPWLTFGRIRPASANAIVYGFGVQSALGVLLWIMCRLGNVRLYFQAALCVAGFIWNLALTVGFIAILGGGNTGCADRRVRNYEFPLSPPARLVSVAMVSARGPVLVCVDLFGSQSVAPLCAGPWRLSKYCECLVRGQSHRLVVYRGGHCHPVLFPS